MSFQFAKIQCLVFGGRLQGNTKLCDENGINLRVSFFVVVKIIYIIERQQQRGVYADAHNRHTGLDEVV